MCGTAIAQPDQQPEATKPTAPRKKTKSKLSFTAALKSAPEEKFPSFIGPQLARASTAPPSGDGWIHELKLDGYRIQIQVRPASDSRKKQVTLLTRKGLDWTHRMPTLARAAEQLPCESAVLDGETVVLDEKGATSFADLQAAFQEGAKVNLTYFAFDLLHLDGHNLRDLPLVERKELLEKLLAGLDDDAPIRFSEHFEADGKKVFTRPASSVLKASSPRSRRLHTHRRAAIRGSNQSAFRNRNSSSAVSPIPRMAALASAP